MHKVHFGSSSSNIANCQQKWSSGVTPWQLQLQKRGTSSEGQIFDVMPTLSREVESACRCFLNLGTAYLLDTKGFASRQTSQQQRHINHHFRNKSTCHETCQLVKSWPARLPNRGFTAFRSTAYATCNTCRNEDVGFAMRGTWQARQRRIVGTRHLNCS